MKTYSMIGMNIGIEVEAENTEEAMQIAENMLLHGLGGYIQFTDMEDAKEYEELC